MWEQDYRGWSQRSLAGRRYAYVWADGVYFNVRLEDTDNKRQCILVLMGATREGKKELIAITDGYRESEQSWRELLLDVRARGLAIDPELAVGDGGSDSGAPCGRCSRRPANSGVGCTRR